MGLNEAKGLLASALEAIDAAKVDACAMEILQAFRNGSKVLIAGNGGSAADAQHFAAELVCTFEKKGRKGFPAYALTTNASVLTAWANDFSFDSVFERQVEALGRSGDVLVSITTSGNSENIVLAMKKARAVGMKNILLSGKGGGRALQLADLAVVIASASTPRVQECHIFCIHEICATVEGESGK